MSVQINTPTNGRDIYTQGVELDGVRYRIRLSWNYRTRSWYMDLFDADDNRIAAGRRLSPGYVPIPAGVPNAPLGTFYVTGGVDQYGREDLGVSIGLVYVPADELAAIEGEAVQSATVTIP